MVAKTQLRSLKYVISYFIVSLSLVIGLSSTAFAETWEQFLDKECGTVKTGEATGCRSEFQQQLKNECGATPSPLTNKYKNCRTDFINGKNDARDALNAGNAAEDSSGFADGTGKGCDWLDSHGDGAKGGTSILDCEGNGVTSLLFDIINFLAVGVGIAVAGGIAWGGFRYSQANGNSSKTQEAVHIIMNSIIGLLLFIFMYALLNWLVPGGLLN